MHIIFIILFAFIGAWGGEAPRILLGGVLGFCLAEIFRLRKHLERQPTLRVNAPEDANVLPTMANTVDQTILATQISESVEFSSGVQETKVEQTVTAYQDYQPYSSEPDWIERFTQFVIAYFTQGNVVVKVGGIILLFGVAFLIKYATEHSMLSVEARLIMSTIAAIVLLSLGWRLRDSRREYALVLQGLGCGIIYMVLCFAYRMYQLIPSNLVFCLMVIVVILSVTLAVLQNAKSLMYMSLFGGFLAPILAAANDDNYVALFTYYLLLNLAIFLVSIFKAWRIMHWLGFMATFVIATSWGILHYVPEDYAYIQFFLMAYFLMYLSISIFYASKQSVNLRGYFDSTLVFGLPLLAFPLQASIVGQFEYGLAWSALALAGIYLTAAKIVMKINQQALIQLVQAFIALSILFATLAIPFAVSERWIGATWALEGAAMVWVGVQQERKWSRWVGCGLQLLAQLVLLDSTRVEPNAMPYFNILSMAQMMVIGSALFSTLWLKMRLVERLPSDNVFAGILFATAQFWSLTLIGLQSLLLANKWQGYWVEMLFGPWYQELILIMAINFAVWGLVLWFWYEKTDFHWFRRVAITTLPILMILQICLVDVPHEHADLIWFGLLATWVFILFRHRRYDAKYINWLHAITVIFINWEGMLFYDSLLRALSVPVSIWYAMGDMLIPLVSLMLILRTNLNRHWPPSQYPYSYFYQTPMLLFAWLVYQIIYQNTYFDGSMIEFPYLPLLNPVDVMTSGSLIMLLVWITTKNYPADGLTRDTTYIESIGAFIIKNFLIIYGVIIFFWLNMILLRTLHQWTGVPYTSSALFHSMMVQMSLSVYWTLGALVIMFSATKYQWREFWFIGAALISLTVAKLMFVDLADNGTLWRVVTFLVVGIMLLIIGYLAPIPPKKSNGELK